MTDAETLELARLRERAYGPHADIADDPVALGRLDELEGRTGSRAVPTPPRPEEAVAPPPDTSSGAPAAPTPAPPSDTAGPVRRSRRVRVPIVWAASVVVAALAATGVTTWVLAAPHGRSLVLGSVAEPTASADRIPLGDNDDLRYFEPLAGIRVASFRQRGEICIVVWDPANTESLRGACAPRSLGPVLDVAVMPTGPVTQEAINRFGTGSTLRLTLQGGAIAVDVAKPAN